MASSPAKTPAPSTPTGEVVILQPVSGKRHHRSAPRFGGGRLTFKQARFAECVALHGLSFAESYRRAYDTGGMTQRTLWRKAGELASNGRVAAQIEGLIREREAAELHDAAAMRDRVINGLLNEAQHGESASARVAAWVALTKLYDLAPPPRLVGDAASLKLELVRKLNEYFGAATPSGS
jgi:hypothetical protein